MHLLYRTGKKPRAFLAGLMILLLSTSLVFSLTGCSEEELFDILGINPSIAIPDTGAGSGTAVHFIDVGQGDAVLIQESGEFALLDAGPPDAEDELIAYLRAAGVDGFAYIIMSHPHADHIGGMQAVIEEFPTDLVLLPDFEKAPYPTTKTFENLLASMLDHQITAETMVQGANYPLGEGYLTVIHDGVESSDNLNLISAAILFSVGDLRFLATGDGEKKNEEAMLASGVDLRANLYKAAHHGSSTSNSEAFVQAVHPDIVVISCGKDNSYGHPHREPLALFSQLGAAVLRTDLDGSVVVQPDSQGDLVYATAA